MKILVGATAGRGQQWCLQVPPSTSCHLSGLHEGESNLVVLFLGRHPQPSTVPRAMLLHLRAP